MLPIRSATAQRGPTPVLSGGRAVASIDKTLVGD